MRYFIDYVKPGWSVYLVTQHIRIAAYKTKIEISKGPSLPLDMCICYVVVKFCVKI